MLLFSEDYIKFFNEVDVDGQPMNQDDQGGSDYTVDDMQPVSPTGNDEDTPAQDEQPAPEEGEAEPQDDGGEDYTQDEGGDEGGEADYTDDGGDAGGDDAGGGEDYTDDGGAEGGDEGGGDAGASGGGDGSVQADDNRGMEEEIFKDLTKDQIDIKHQELKSNFTKIYDATSSLIDRLNDLPSNEMYMATISFVGNQLADLRQLVTDYINNVYSTKSYMENSINYNKFLMTLKGINDILEEVYKDLEKESQ